MMTSGSPWRKGTFRSDIVEDVTDVPETLSRRALNRALLARQLLLERRSDVAPSEAVEHLLGLQAQATAPPYLGLFSRLHDFDPHELGRMITDRQLVRLTLMRGTVHLVTASDALLLRPLVQPVIERGFNGTFGRRMTGVDRDRLAAATREVLSGGEQPTAREIAGRLIDREIGDDLEALAVAVRVHVPLVQVPPRGVWGAGGQARYATLESWTGREPHADPSIDDVVERYLRAFGPASAMDVQSWSGLTGLKAVLERLRPRLVTFDDERGTELFDLPDAPRPDPDVPAPARMLGEFDNVLLGHANRRRIITDGLTPWMDSITGGRHVNNLLIDGMLRAVWWIEREGKRSATLAIRPTGKLTRGERDEVHAEATRVLEFAEARAEVRNVRFERPAR